MSALPERKKSAEEIARMREQMGLPFVSPAQADSPMQKPVEPEACSVSPPARSERESVGESLSPEIPLASGLPVRRRSQRELDELRRREALRAVSLGTPSALPFQAKTANWSLVILGYLLALATVAGTWHPLFMIPKREGYWLAFGGGGAALLIAGFIAWRKPLSRHHAGFVAVTVALVLVFALLYYYPNLNPAHAP
ncbi:MAG TPA: hypothetical protein VIM57_05960 [Luteolibacter sp.]